MEPQPSVPSESHGRAATTYTVSLTARACLQALQTAAWIEAMVLAHRAADPQGAGSWLWFLGRCALFTVGAYLALGILTQITRRRDAHGGVAEQQERQEPQETPGPARLLFDAAAYKATASAVFFHFGSPLWMWIFA